MSHSKVQATLRHLLNRAIADRRHVETVAIDNFARVANTFQEQRVHLRQQLQNRLRLGVNVRKRRNVPIISLSDI